MKKFLLVILSLIFLLAACTTKELKTTQVTSIDEVNGEDFIIYIDYNFNTYTTCAGAQRITKINSKGKKISFEIPSQFKEFLTLPKIRQNEKNTIFSADDIRVCENEQYIAFTKLGDNISLMYSKDGQFLESVDFKDTVGELSTNLSPGNILYVLDKYECKLYSYDMTDKGENVVDLDRDTYTSLVAPNDEFVLLGNENGITRYNIQLKNCFQYRFLTSSSMGQEAQFYVYVSPNNYDNIYLLDSCQLESSIYMLPFSDFLLESQSSSSYKLMSFQGYPYIELANVLNQAAAEEYNKVKSFLINDTDLCIEMYHSVDENHFFTAKYDMTYKREKNDNELTIVSQSSLAFNAQYNDIVNEIEKKYNGLTVENDVYTYDDENKKLSIRLLTENDFDILCLTPNRILTIYPYLEDIALDISTSDELYEIYNSLENKYSSFVTKDGAVYGLVNIAVPFVYECNKQYFEENNIPLPDENWTYDDFFDLCYGAAGNNKKAGSFCYLDFILLMQAYAESMINFDDKECYFSSQEFVNILTDIKTLVDKGVFSKELVMINMEDNKDEYIFSYNYYLFSPDSIKRELLPCPSAPGGKIPVGTSDNFIIINKNSKHLEQCIEFVEKYVSSKFVFGSEYGDNDTHIAVLQTQKYVDFGKQISEQSIETLEHISSNMVGYPALMVTNSLLDVDLDIRTQYSNMLDGNISPEEFAQFLQDKFTLILME